MSTLGNTAVPILKNGVVLGYTTMSGWRRASDILGISGARFEKRSVNGKLVYCWTDK